MIKLLRGVWKRFLVHHPLVEVLRAAEKQLKASQLLIEFLYGGHLKNAKSLGGIPLCLPSQNAVKAAACEF
jgi:hypothetical protein